MASLVILFQRGNEEKMTGALMVTIDDFKKFEFMVAEIKEAK